MTVPARIPYYKPNIYPAVLQRNVSVFGRFLGESDVDKISDQQNTTNIIHGNIIDKLLASGSYMTLPNKASVKTDPSRKKIVRIDLPQDVPMFSSISMDEDIGPDMMYLTQLYEEARQAIGITDSFQGRKDTTATSGKAKEFAAAQSAGRLESKRVMKDAAFAYLFEAMFKFRLAYADEPRPVVTNSIEGQRGIQRIQPIRFPEAGRRGRMVLERQIPVFLRYVSSACVQPGSDVAGNKAEPSDGGVRRSGESADPAAVLDQDGAAALSGRRAYKEVYREDNTGAAADEDAAKGTAGRADENRAG